MEINDLEASLVGLSIERLVLAAGVPSPSLRAIASEAGVAHSTIADWFGRKPAMLLRCATEFVVRHRDFMSSTWAGHGFAGLASPGVASSDALVRRSFWIAWARSVEGGARIVDAIHHAEREVIRDALVWEAGGPPTADEVVRIHAALLGSWDLGVCLIDLPNVRKIA